MGSPGKGSGSEELESGFSEELSGIGATIPLVMMSTSGLELGSEELDRGLTELDVSATIIPLVMMATSELELGVDDELTSGVAEE